MSEESEMDNNETPDALKSLTKNSKITITKSKPNIKKEIEKSESESESDDSGEEDETDEESNPDTGDDTPKGPAVSGTDVTLLASGSMGSSDIPAVALREVCGEDDL